MKWRHVLLLDCCKRIDHGGEMALEKAIANTMSCKPLVSNNCNKTKWCYFVETFIDHAQNALLDRLGCIIFWQILCRCLRRLWLKWTLKQTWGKHHINFKYLTLLSWMVLWGAHFLKSWSSLDSNSTRITTCDGLYGGLVWFRMWFDAHYIEAQGLWNYQRKVDFHFIMDLGERLDDMVVEHVPWVDPTSCTCVRLSKGSRFDCQNFLWQ